MGMNHWKVKILSPAKEHMKGIKDRRIQERLASALRRLEDAPAQQGKLLSGELADYHSVRAVSQRYRIIYYLHQDSGIVFVVGVGIRKEGDKNDVYTQTKKLLRRGLFNLNVEIEKIIDSKEETSSPSSHEEELVEEGESEKTLPSSVDERESTELNDSYKRE